MLLCWKWLASCHGVRSAIEQVLHEKGLAAETLVELRRTAEALRFECARTAAEQTAARTAAEERVQSVHNELFTTKERTGEQRRAAEELAMQQEAAAKVDFEAKADLAEAQGKYLQVATKLS